ncbi:MAG TPA: hypothetical protein VHD61_05945 [Lacunisphaera sp.]|nr:hypothetical protein [Lacunisphaera sp.]
MNPAGPGPDSSPPVAGTTAPRLHRVLLLAALAAPLAFALWTHEVWEDYYIAFRSSRNLAEGHGLVYQIGERVQTFSSPLGVLLPALGYGVTGSDAGALWIVRIVGALALAGATALVLGHLGERHGTGATGALAVGLGLFEGKVVAFSANGMETGLYVFFGALAWRELTRRAGPRPGRLAAAYAGLMWTRADGCVLAGALTLAWWCFGPRDRSPAERSWWRATLTAIATGMVAYLPWVLWTWHYYGSPVPQTVVAKSALAAAGFSASHLLLAPLRCLVTATSLDGLFGPVYLTGGWPASLILACRVFARLSAFLWLLPVLPRETRAASLAVMLGAVYLNQVVAFPWYYAPWTMLGGLALAGAGRQLLAAAPAAVRPSLRVAAGLVVLGGLGTNVAQAAAARAQQAIIEDGGRKQIGRWLRDHAQPGDRVFLEPTGYIGYFSQLKILDFPGLVAPEVTAIVRRGPGGYARIIHTLQPDWLVLRPLEIASQNLADSGALAAYDPVMVFDQSARLAARGPLPAASWLVVDAQFIIYHRRRVAPPAS